MGYGRYDASAAETAGSGGSVCTGASALSIEYSMVREQVSRGTPVSIVASHFNHGYNAASVVVSCFNSSTLMILIISCQHILRLVSKRRGCPPQPSEVDIHYWSVSPVVYIALIVRAFLALSESLEASLAAYHYSLLFTRCTPYGPACQSPPHGPSCGRVSTHRTGTPHCPMWPS